MLKNEGYINAYVVRDRFDYWNLDEKTQSAMDAMVEQERASSAKCMAKLYASERGVEVTPELEDKFRNEATQRYKRTNVSSRAFENFLKEHRIFLSASDGVVIEADFSIMKAHWRPKKSGRMTIRGKVDKFGAFKPTAPTAPKPWDYPWSFIDKEFLSVRVKEHLADLELARTDLGRDKASEENVYEFEHLAANAELEPLARRLLPYEGALIAFREEDAPDHRAIKKWLGLKTPSGGRRTKKDRAAQAYVKLYPKGHEARDHSVKTVLDAIYDEIKERVTWETVKAGLAKFYESD